ncbi:signal recognition particle subunit SRP9 [Hepatocystis sp. ex Piliocolobus tephrosceles]|nr:signal recognition particle subunit SRP9 [Hepatocystis sp. ex Piliocolobus tephrosceles]
MVYAKSWSEFLQATRDIILESPDKTRYVIKLHRPSEAMILKVTDNSKCIMYRLIKSDNFKKIEELNSLFLTWGINDNPKDAFSLKLKNVDKTSNEHKYNKVK